MLQCGVAVYISMLQRDTAIPPAHYGGGVLRCAGLCCCSVCCCDVVAACVAVMLLQRVLLCGVACSACCSVSHIMLEALRKAACLISVLFI